jgi:hypothetical protein
MPPAVIARTYYDPDEDAHAATPGAMERHLTKMLDALAHGSTALADHLRASICQHGRPLLTAVTFRMVSEAAQLAALPPHPDHAIGAWADHQYALRLSASAAVRFDDGQPDHQGSECAGDAAKAARPERGRRPPGAKSAELERYDARHCPEHDAPQNPDACVRAWRGA